MKGCIKECQYKLLVSKYMIYGPYGFKNLLLTLV